MDDCGDCCCICIDLDVGSVDEGNGCDCNCCDAGDCCDCNCMGEEGCCKNCDCNCPIDCCNADNSLCCFYSCASPMNAPQVVSEDEQQQRKDKQGQLCCLCVTLSTAFIGIAGAIVLIALNNTQ